MRVHVHVGICICICICICMYPTSLRAMTRALVSSVPDRQPTSGSSCSVLSIPVCMHAYVHVGTWGPQTSGSSCSVLSIPVCMYAYVHVGTWEPQTTCAYACSSCSVLSVRRGLGRGACCEAARSASCCNAAALNVSAAMPSIDAVRAAMLTLERSSSKTWGEG